jgi:hypothetical protein
VTRKDYKVLADALGKAWADSLRLPSVNPGEMSDVEIAIGSAVHEVALALASDNSRFDVARFVDAVWDARQARRNG